MQTPCAYFIAGRFCIPGTAGPFPGKAVSRFGLSRETASAFPGKGFPFPGNIPGHPQDKLWETTPFPSPFPALSRDTSFPSPFPSPFLGHGAFPEPFPEPFAFPRRLLGNGLFPGKGAPFPGMQNLPAMLGSPRAPPKTPTAPEYKNNKNIKNIKEEGPPHPNPLQAAGLHVARRRHTTLVQNAHRPHDDAWHGVCSLCSRSSALRTAIRGGYSRWRPQLPSRRRHHRACRRRRRACGRRHGSRIWRGRIARTLPPWTPS